MAAWLIVAPACGDDARGRLWQRDAAGVGPSDSGAPTSDAGRDAGVAVDASSSTGAAIDSGVSGLPDSAVPDAAMPDAGMPDAGTPDAGMPDAGMPDAGPPDAGPPDAGPPDAGPPDAGPPDAGPRCPAGQMLCDDSCVDSSDPDNCGGCGVTCGPYQECSSGTCEDLPYGLGAHRSSPCTLSDPPPTSLSATGCYANVSRLEPAAGLIPYSVASRLWSDGTHKQRYLYVPPGETIGYTDYGVWNLPVGTILVKEFRIHTVEGDPSSEIALETRFWVRRSAGWDGYTYKWNAAQTDATRTSGGRDDYTITRSDGSTATYTHWFPNSDECAFCHNAANGVSIGMRTLQMNRDYAYPMATDNQLRTLAHIGVLSALPTTPDVLPAMPDPMDTSAPRAERARSYLQGNCAHCHFPGGPSARSIDLRFETSFASTHTCGVAPEGSDLGVTGARIIDPGSPSSSVLYLRVNRRGWAQMPLVGTLAIDPDGTALLRSWIAGLSGCP